MSMITNNTTPTRRNNGNNNSSTTQACAACKYQRKKCAPDCILAPYFIHDRQRQFLNAHKLFGVSNIIKIIKHLDPHDKDQAMRTIIYQSDMRANDPVGGCYRYIQDLQAQIEYYHAELELVLQQLAIFRAQAHHQQQQQQQQHHVLYAPTPNNAVNVPINSDGEVLNNNNNIGGDPLNLYNYMAPRDEYIMGHENENNRENSNNTNTLLPEHVDSWAMQNSIFLSSLSLQGQSSNVSDEFDHKLTLDMHSDERSELAFEPKELVHGSDEADILFKIDEANCIQQAQDHDLKSAATLFTLTNCTSS